MLGYCSFGGIGKTQRTATISLQVPKLLPQNVTGHDNLHSSRAVAASSPVYGVQVPKNMASDAGQVRGRLLLCDAVDVAAAQQDVARRHRHHLAVWERLLHHLLRTALAPTASSSTLAPTTDH